MLFLGEKLILSTIACMQLCCKNDRYKKGSRKQNEQVKKKQSLTSTTNAMSCCSRRKEYLKKEMEELCNGREEKLRRNSSESADKYASETLHSLVVDDLAFFTPRSYYNTVDLNGINSQFDLYECNIPTFEIV